MIYVRSIVFIVFMALSVAVVCLPIVVLSRLAPFSAIGHIGRSWGYWNLAALKLLCGLDLRIRGLENIPEEPVVVLCKHQSAWEILALRAILPMNQVWVVKRELMRIPIFASALAPYNPIAIDRDAGRKSVKQLLDEGQKWLTAGRPIIVFPEGTRVPPGERKPYSIGGALLAERSGRPVLPIAHNAGVFWARRSIAKYPGTVDLVIGPTIPVTGKKAQDINREAECWIEDTVSGLPSTRAAEGA